MRAVGKQFFVLGMCQDQELTNIYNIVDTAPTSKILSCEKFYCESFYCCLTVCAAPLPPSLRTRQAAMPQRNRRQDSMVLHNNHINHQLHDYLVTSGVSPRYPTSTLESLGNSSAGTNTYRLSDFTNGAETPDYVNYMDPSDLEAGADPDPPPGDLTRSISMSSVATSIANTGMEKKKLNTDAVRVLKAGFIFILFVSILICATLSKITFIAVASKLYDTVVNASNYTGTTRNDPTYQSVTFTQIVMILIAPQVVTIVRMFFAGIVGKSEKNYPWPSIKATIGVRNISIRNMCCLALRSVTCACSSYQSIP